MLTSYNSVLWLITHSQTCALLHSKMEFTYFCVSFIPLLQLLTGEELVGCTLEAKSCREPGTDSAPSAPSTHHDDLQGENLVVWWVLLLLKVQRLKKKNKKT